MPFLYDTCTISEFMQTTPNPKVVAYLAALPNHEIHISAISIGKIHYGIELLPVSAKRSRLQHWYANWILPSFAGRILPNDFAVMERWGPMMAALERRGLKMAIKDSLIAACALASGLTVITRNQIDFAHCGVKVVNPWGL